MFNACCACCVILSVNSFWSDKSENLLNKPLSQSRAVSEAKKVLVGHLRIELGRQNGTVPLAIVQLCEYQKQTVETWLCVPPFLQEGTRNTIFAGTREASVKPLLS